MLADPRMLITCIQKLFKATRRSLARIPRTQYESTLSTCRGSAPALGGPIITVQHRAKTHTFCKKSYPRLASLVTDGRLALGLAPLGSGTKSKPSLEKDDLALPCWTVRFIFVHLRPTLLEGGLAAAPSPRRPACFASCPDPLVAHRPGHSGRSASGRYAHAGGQCLTTVNG